MTRRSFLFHTDDCQRGIGGRLARLTRVISSAFGRRAEIIRMTESTDFDLFFLPPSPPAKSSALPSWGCVDLFAFLGFTLLPTDRPTETEDRRIGRERETATWVERKMPAAARGFYFAGGKRSIVTAFRHLLRYWWCERNKSSDSELTEKNDESIAVGIWLWPLSASATRFQTISFHNKKTYQNKERPKEIQYFLYLERDRERLASWLFIIHRYLSINLAIYSVYLVLILIDWSIFKDLLTRRCVTVSSFVVDVFSIKRSFWMVDSIWLIFNIWLIFLSMIFDRFQLAGSQ